MQAIGYRRRGGGVPVEAGDELAPLDSQHHALIGTCVARGLDLTIVYTEAAQGSAQFRRLLQDASRLTPPPRIVLPHLEVLGATARERVFRALQLQAMHLPVLLATGEDLAEAMLAAWRARDASERHRERVREGMRRLALRGHALGRPPYGYRVVEQRLQLEPTEAEVVRSVARMYLHQDLGIRRVAAALNDRGVRTRRGGPWSAAAIRDMLRNPVYLGTYRRLGVIVAGAHRPILQRADFDAIQARMARRRTAPSRQERHDYLLAGLASCGYCGNRLIGVRRPGAGDATLIYYQCESATNHGRCSYHTRRADELETEVRAHLAAGGLARVPGVAPPPEAEDAQRLEGRRRNLQREIERTLEHWSAGEWSTPHLLEEAGPRALADLEAEEALEALAAVAEGAPADVDAERQRLLEGWDGLEFAERRWLLQHVVAEVVVTDNAVRVALAG